jgi:Arc/MetJ-type ribon-helix-helix transcriptional regulator
MNQILLEIDNATLARLERVAPSRSRKRSEFLRAAIQRALWEIEERETRAAYLQTPDTDAEAALDPSTWEAPTPARRVATRARRPRSTRKR